MEPPVLAPSFLFTYLCYFLLEQATESTSPAAFPFSPLAGLLVPLTGLASRLLISAGRGSGPVLPPLLTQALSSTLRFSHRSLLAFPESRAKTELRSPAATCCPSKPRAMARSGLIPHSYVPPSPASARPSARRPQRRPGAIFLLRQGPWLSWPAGKPSTKLRHLRFFLKVPSSWSRVSS